MEIPPDAKIIDAGTADHIQIPVPRITSDHGI